MRKHVYCGSNPMPNTFHHFFIVSSLSSVLIVVTGGNSLSHWYGLHALTMMRLLEKSPAFRLSGGSLGSRGVLVPPFRISTSVSGSHLVAMAQMTWLRSVGSISSSTTITHLPK